MTDVSAAMPTRLGVLVLYMLKKSGLNLKGGLPGAVVAERESVMLIKPKILFDQGIN